MADKILNAFDVWITAQGVKSRTRLRSVDNISLDGINRLRELVLDLAISGKIVQRIANDKPASLLLKKSEEEKNRLVDLKKINKQKQLPEIIEDEMPFELPNGWKWAWFADLYFFQEGPGIRNWQFRNEGIKLLNVQNIVDNKLILDNTDKYIDVAEYEEKYRHFTIEEDDLVFASSGGSWGKSAFFIDPGYKVIVNTSTIRLKPYISDVSRGYLKSFLDSKFFKKQMIAQLVGMQPNFGSTHLLKVIVPVPPHKEQHAIASKVDELMALCDALEQQEAHHLKSHQLLVETLLGTLTHAADANEFQQAWSKLYEHFDELFTTEDSIDQLKQTILQLAVMGKLVPQDPNDEPAGELLKRIMKEKEVLVMEGKIKQQKAYAEELVIPSIITPQTWSLVKCQDISLKITDGEHATPNRSDSGYYLLSARNVTNEGIILDDVDFVPEEEFNRIRKRCDPNIGDILISCSGSVGRVALVDRDNAYAMVRSAAMIRPSSTLSKEYIVLLLKSPQLQSQIKSKSKQSAQANLFLGAISELILPIATVK